MSPGSNDVDVVAGTAEGPDHSQRGPLFSVGHENPISCNHAWTAGSQDYRARGKAGWQR